MKQQLQVVLVSPSDVGEEREAAERVGEYINTRIAKNLNFSLEPARWEDLHPGACPDGPQQYIDSKLRVQDADLVIGVFWRRFGTAVAGSESGTEHEIRLAYHLNPDLLT